VFPLDLAVFVLAGESQLPIAEQSLPVVLARVYDDAEGWHEGLRLGFEVASAVETSLW